MQGAQQQPESWCCCVSGFRIQKKNAFYKKIDYCLDIILKDENYKRFIGVYDQHELKMQKTPKGMVKDSTAKSSELLKEFYDKN